MSKRKSASVRLATALTGMALLTGCTTVVSGEARPGGVVDAGKQFELTGGRLIRAAACLAINAKLGAVPVGKDKYNNAAHRTDLPQVEVSRRAYIFDPTADGWGQAYADWYKSDNISNYAAMYMAGPVDANNPFWRGDRLDSSSVAAVPEGMHVEKFSLWQSGGRGSYVSREAGGAIVAHTLAGDFPLNGAGMQAVNDQAEQVIKTLNEHAHTAC